MHTHPFIFALLFICAALPACHSSTNTQAKTQTITIHDHTFHLQLALTDAARYQGLSGRKHIPRDAGMLFAFPQSQILYFVMRRCYVPIDLIYLDGNGRVVTTHHMTVQPYDTPEDQLTVYSSVYPAQFAIELKGGLLNQLHLTPGEQLHLPTTSLKHRAQ